MAFALARGSGFTQRARQYVGAHRSLLGEVEVVVGNSQRGVLPTPVLRGMGLPLVEPPLVADCAATADPARCASCFGARIAPEVGGARGSDE